MADRDVLELANDEEFGDGGMDDMENEVPEYKLFFSHILEHEMDDNEVLDRQFFHAPTLRWRTRW